jgi:flagella basal body P-ring formation protein FlgA
MQFLLLFFSIFFSCLTFACQVYLPKYIIKIPKVRANYSEVIKTKKCSGIEKNEINKRLNQLQGNVPLSMVTDKEILSNHTSIDLIPLKRLIEHLTNEKLDRFEITQSLGHHSLVPFNQYDEISIKPMSKKEHFRHYSIKVINKYINVQLKKTHHLMVYKSKHFINKYSSNINESFFNKVYIKTTKPEQYFQDFDQVQYYKNTVSIEKNKILERKAMTPVLLVKRGEEVEVEAVSNNLEVKAKAKALENGRLNDSIMLENMKTRKKFKAKIKDFKLVEVRL